MNTEKLNTAGLNTVAMLEKQHNWAGNYTYSAARLHYPETVAQVQALVRASHKLRVLGSRHSFNSIADSTEDLVSLERFDPVGVIDHERHTVTVAGGVRYGQLCEQLQREGYALPNMASLPHISIAGACATATHGSGDHNGSLATSVSALELVTADGEVVVLSRDQQPDQLQGAIVGLGGLGVVTHLMLDLLPSSEERIAQVEDVLSLGQKLMVRVAKVDDRGKLDLIRPELEGKIPPREARPERSGGDRGPRR